MILFGTTGFTYTSIVKLPYRMYHSDVEILHALGRMPFETTADFSRSGGECETPSDASQGKLSSRHSSSGWSLHSAGMYAPANNPGTTPHTAALVCPSDRPHWLFPVVTPICGAV